MVQRVCVEAAKCWEVLMELRVRELKALARRHGLSERGPKWNLVKRLMANAARITLLIEGV